MSNGTDSVGTLDDGHDFPHHAEVIDGKRCDTFVSFGGS
jgi:hypothetical protein